MFNITCRGCKRTNPKCGCRFVTLESKDDRTVGYYVCKDCEKRGYKYEGVQDKTEE